MENSLIRKPNLSINKLAEIRPVVGRLTSLPKSPKLEKQTKRRLTRYGLVVGNIALLIGVAFFLVINRSASQTIRSGTLNSFVATSSSKTAALDELSSAQIALTAARMTRLPETTAVRNQADSDSILLKIVPNDAVSVSKPVIVATSQKSKHDIIQYTALASDTAASVANKFGVSAESIRWSNGLSSNAIPAGTKLQVPPVNGVVYTVRSGDTPAGLASRFRADEGQIITFNDAEINGLQPGDKIIIPNGQQSAPLTYGTFAATYGGNGYDFGYCTWYVASQIAVPTNWGNANTWDNYAALSGWTVTTTPRAGAIAQNDGGWLGHVAIVSEVSSDGTMVKYSDMNGLAGWGRVGYSDWTPATHFNHYIYH